MISTNSIPRYSSLKLFFSILAIALANVITPNVLGQGWTNQTSSTYWALSGVAAIDSNNCWVVGEDGTILHTTNGGSTWTTQTSGTNSPLTYVTFLNDSVGWVGGYGTILKTTNGGTVWNLIPNIAAYGITAITFVDSSNGWFVGGYPYCGIIRHTTNGGNTWVTQDSLVPLSFYGVAFVNDSTGWAVGDSCSIFRTTNRGNTWVEQHYTVNGSWLGCVSFSDERHGWVVGDRGVILHTTNGGETFVADKPSVSLPKKFELLNNYPNPFNSTTHISFSLPTASQVKLTIYDALGRELKTIVNEKLNPGFHNAVWNASSVGSGVYFVKMSAGNYNTTKKIVLLK